LVNNFKLFGTNQLPFDGFNIRSLVNKNSKSESNNILNRNLYEDGVPLLEYNSFAALIAVLLLINASLENIVKNH